MKNNLKFNQKVHVNSRRKQRVLRNHENEQKEEISVSTVNKPQQSQSSSSRGLFRHFNNFIHMFDWLRRFLLQYKN